MLLRRPLLRPAMVLALVAGPWLCACSGPLSNAKSLFARGRYAAAKQALVSLDVDSRTWNDARRAEYALYRGATLAALGDGAHARGWLLRARSLQRKHGGLLSAEDAERLAIVLDANELN